MISLEEIKELKDQGLTYAKIGEKVGVSRQRIHQILRGNKQYPVLSKEEKMKARYAQYLEMHKEFSVPSDGSPMSYEEYVFRVDIDRMLTVKEKRVVYERDNFTCQYCGQKDIRKLQVDHRTPRSRGGTHDLNNLITACRKCNSKKAYKTYEEFINNEKIKIPNFFRGRPQEENYQII